VALGIELRAPGLSRCAFEGISRQPLRRNVTAPELWEQFVRHRDQGFAGADGFVLTDGYDHAREPRLARGNETHSLIGCALERSRSLGDLPHKLQVLLDPSPGTIARQRP